eukprot:CAMPEP_0169426112 /NCGR_PEP_ID=MMETSP1042-20121227/13_1 /TAXON_ID=464988 /ORGANISM="Hemiselmis andersenii, Strain CCMP1180" /LENGTH=54 /DNA_ID=CAMNT_0009535981 /DNA_START=533 /DNA_END=693 /DNA_ORIENTATION=-
MSSHVSSPMNVDKTLKVASTTLSAKNPIAMPLEAFQIGGPAPGMGGEETGKVPR